MRGAAILASLALLTACDGQPSGSGEPSSTAYFSNADAEVESDGAILGDASGQADREVEGESARSPTEDAPQGGQMLAYAYDAAVMVPPGAVAGVMATHRDACQAAGPSMCQVLSASLFGQDEDRVSAALSFRAAPSYVADFRAALVGDAQDAGGRLVSEQQRVEDLTRQVLDLRARLDAQRTLRERLAALLERQDGAVADLLAAEQELARVQGTIESMVGQLRYLEGRVAMNTMTVDYRSAPQAFTPAKRRPLVGAVRDFFGLMAESVAAVIRFVALALPWVLIGLPALWLLRRTWRRLRV